MSIIGKASIYYPSCFQVTMFLFLYTSTPVDVTLLVLIGFTSQTFSLIDFETTQQFFKFTRSQMLSFTHCDIITVHFQQYIINFKADHTES